MVLLSTQIAFNAFFHNKSSLYSFIAVSYKHGNVLTASIRYSLAMLVAAILPFSLYFCYCSAASQCIKVEFFQLWRIVTHRLKNAMRTQSVKKREPYMGSVKKRIKCELGLIGRSSYIKNLKSSKNNYFWDIF